MLPIPGLPDGALERWYYVAVIPSHSIDTQDTRGCQCPSQLELAESHTDLNKVSDHTYIHLDRGCGRCGQCNVLSTIPRAIPERVWVVHPSVVRVQTVEWAAQVSKLGERAVDSRDRRLRTSSVLRVPMVADCRRCVQAARHS